MRDRRAGHAAIALRPGSTLTHDEIVADAFALADGDAHIMMIPRGVYPHGRALQQPLVVGDMRCSSKSWQYL